MASAKKIREGFAACRHYCIMLLVTVFVLFPYFWLFLSSVKPPHQQTLSPTVWVPDYLDFSSYLTVWKTIPMMRYMLNSLFVSLCTVIMCLVFSVTAAYSLSRYAFKGKYGVIGTILFSQLIPGMLPFVSFYFMMFSLRLTNNYAGLIIAYAIWGIPFSTLMMRSYFTAAIPRELEESAIIDGCTRWGVFLRIAIPLAVPGIIATAIFAFILSWNEFMWASVMITNNMIKTVAVGIYDYIGQFGGNVRIAMTMATAVLATLPAMLIFCFLQRYLISGLTSGAVKG
ncbi:MAG: carbohydrate ABC transporter permease [Treponema sp.]|jgi:ABC-type glycerol-3-phosphate transport system permease component|nr:carbohydrate ABC transporter permease [Treponema sp.]